MKTVFFHNFDSLIFIYIKYFFIIVKNLFTTIFIKKWKKMRMMLYNFFNQVYIRKIIENLIFFQRDLNPIQIIGKIKKYK